MTTDTTKPTVDALAAAITAGDPRYTSLRTAPGARTFRDEQGRSLLHLAAINGHPDAVREMLLIAIDPTVQDADGKTALDLASSDAARHLLEWAPGHAFPYFVRLREAIEANDLDALEAAKDDWYDYIEVLLESDEAVFETFHYSIPAWMTWDGELLRVTASQADGPVRFAGVRIVDGLREDGTDDEDDDYDE
ncbi:ankyrin repeat domain-containing protein [Burkholderia sp. LMG 13014]|uniref:ankyrin repeat domain-containing protein n=1 Tax=Burkholderia sp. LMG 13014 TaxID=2709306 RepID=UPI00196276ED|nr:ankyrin repeat domain-containing protein [Burkholderia sp. LMG 13014]